MEAHSVGPIYLSSPGTHLGRVRRLNSQLEFALNRKVQRWHRNILSCFFPPKDKHKPDLLCSSPFTPPAFPSLVLLFSNEFFDFLFILSLPVADVGSPQVVSGLRNDDIGDE